MVTKIKRTKFCRRCNAELPLSKFYVYRYKSGDGVRVVRSALCRTHQVEYNSEWYQRNKKRYADYKRRYGTEYRKKHRERIRTYNRLYRRAYRARKRLEAEEALKSRRSRRA
ncbi:MAG: hypothetical protein HY304_03400 [candidate division Zixibacteria bacterium]|nr:hypothetical protein [candidate division Zixibacteria bacterium]